METASEPSAQFSDYPVNLFDESRDHANQWDMTALLQKHEEKKRERAIHLTDYPVNLFDESRDHANQWDMTALLHKPTRADQA